MARNLFPDDTLVCTNPFEWLEVHPDGTVFVCCPAWLKTPLGNLLHEPLESLWNGPQALRIRKAVLNGSFHHCSHKRCPHLAGRTAPVMRPADIDNAAVREAVAGRQAVLPFGPKQLNLCYDRSCNLACPTCRRGFESARGTERERVDLLTRRIVEEAGPGAEQLILSGFGDPFASPALRPLLQGFQPRRWPQLNAVHLHSNGQLWDAAMWETLAAVHPYVCTAEISVDAATPQTYAVNRRGGDFDRLLANLAFLQTLPVAVKLSCVVQANNYREMPAFVELAERHGFRAYFSQLVNWGTFSREAFRRRAVHLPGHPEHDQFVAVLKEVAGRAGVDIGNLRPLLEAAG